jgi:hypothetical protein
MAAISAPDSDNATADAKAVGLIDETIEQRQYDGTTYSVFGLRDSSAAPRSANTAPPVSCWRRGDAMEDNFRWSCASGNAVAAGT